jgi:glyoxylase-like metal-dependent hydrolase (beta-lactamase superfamily II)
VVSDTQFPEQAANMLAEIRKVNANKINLLINTHHHGDHTAGNIVFKDMVEKVVSHENCRINLEKTALAQNALDKNLLADTVVIDKASFKLAKESVECRYFGRGHTNGDIVVHFENANIAHLGDLVFNRRFPFIDVPGGASIDQWIETLEKIVKYYDKDTIFICGHSNEKYPVQINKSDIRAMQNYLDKLRIYIKQQVKDGLTEEAVIAKTTIIPGAEEWTGDGVVRSLKAGFAEYKAM